MGLRRRGRNVTERIQKIIARSGLCSRRAAEALLRQGRVTVDGQVATLGQSAAENAVISVDGKEISLPEKYTYLMLHKPRGYTCSMADDHAEHLVGELVAGCGVKVYPVGRLDRDSEGVLLMTNDGAFMERMTHPSHQMDKVYRVSVSGAWEGCEDRIAAITNLDGESVMPAQVTVLRRDGSDAEMEITIHQGRKRQIRRLCAKAGLSVRRLVRIQEDKLSLGDLPCGQWRYLTDEEIKEAKGGGVQ